MMAGNATEGAYRSMACRVPAFNENKRKERLPLPRSCNIDFIFIVHEDAGHLPLAMVPCM